MNLAGKNLTETFVASVDDFWAPYTNTGGLDLAATLTLETTARGIIVTELDDSFCGSGNAISVVLSGPGEFDFEGANAYTGGTTIDGGVLDLVGSDSAGTGGIAFGAAAHATLAFTPARFDPGNTISIPDATDAIEFDGVAYTDGERLAEISSGAVSTYALESAGGLTLATLRLTGAFDGADFVAAPYFGYSGASYIAAVYSAAAAASDETSILNSPTPILIADTEADIGANRAAIETLIDDNVVSAFYINDVYLVYDGARGFSVFGGGDSLICYGGADLGLFNTAGAWDGVNLQDGTVRLDDAAATIDGPDDTIDLASGGGDSVSLYDTGNRGDTVNGSAATIYANNAIASVVGSADIVVAIGDVSPNDVLWLSGTDGYWDLVGATNTNVNLTGAQASVVGGGDKISLANIASEFESTVYSAVSLYATNGSADTVNATGDYVYLNSVQANLTGGFSNSVIFGGGDTLNLENEGYTYLLFNPGVGGQDTIGGFGPTDNITFSHADFANFAAVSSHLSQSGGNAVITLNAADSITLKGVQASSLTAAEFAFY